MARKTVERNISYDDIRRRWYVSMDLGRDDQGKRRKRYRTYTSLPAARAGLREFLSHREQEISLCRCPITLGQWLDQWMQTIVRPNRAETTAYAYQKIIDNHLRPALGDRPLLRLTPGDVQLYYIHVQQSAGLSSNTLRHHHNLLSSAFRAAVKQNILLRSPMDRVEPPRARLHETNFYSPDTLKRLYSLLAGRPLELPARLAGSLGLRRGELCGLKWENVDFQRQVICICEARTTFGAEVVQKEPKNNASVRTLYIPDEILQLLSSEWNRQQYSPQPLDGYVIRNRKGQPYSPNALSLAFTRFVRKNHLPCLTLHGLRHSFATVAACQGVPLFDIGKALGHANPSTTGRIYTHLVDRTHTETLTRVSNALR